MHSFSITLISSFHGTQLVVDNIKANTAKEAAEQAYKMVADPSLWLIYDVMINQ